MLELEPSDPIAGALSREGGAARPFSGWLSLMALLNEELRNDVPHLLSTDPNRTQRAGDADPADPQQMEVEE